MWAGTVVGTVVATQKDESLVGSKLLLVAPLAFGRNGLTTVVVAVDRIGAGTGERVLVAGGSSARSVTGRAQSAVDAAIIGIIDSMEVHNDLLEESRV